ncbi:MAG: hypothetical protein H0X17_25365 [Deltaproteobacteria bacterium]|nr:hypothetical protein [Deltaproteobacteria bacterium]
MACPRCDVETVEDRWCAECERAYDTWSRRNASDMIWPVLTAMLIVTAVGVGLPLLGFEFGLAATGVFGGFGALVAMTRANSRRRRKQFVLGAAIPRAYLPDKT